jgi:hypothetical protein
MLEAAPALLLSASRQRTRLVVERTGFEKQEVWLWS